MFRLTDSWVGGRSMAMRMMRVGMVLMELLMDPLLQQIDLATPQVPMNGLAVCHRNQVYQLVM